MKRPATNIYSNTKRGRREDLGNHFFRSSWEANYARYLNFQVKAKFIYHWEYEPDTFWFEAIRRGTRSYLPDFKIYKRGKGGKTKVYYVEVKGWMDAKSKTKLKRMAKYHPDIEIRVVGGKEYKAIKKQFGRILDNWE